MMYRCCNCGNMFEEGEQAVWHENYGAEIGGEYFSGCPLCRGDFEEVHQCKECGDWHYEDERYDGWCEKCLRETINYDTFCEYCEANKDENYLDTFVMCYLLNCDEVPKYPSWDFHQLMIATYKNYVQSIQNAKKCGSKAFHDILPDCVQFIMDDDGSIGRENYADWLNSKKEVK